MNYRLLIVFLLAAHMTGCTSSRPAPDERPSAAQMAPPADVDSPAFNVESLPKKVPSSTEKGTKPGILSGISQVFSTPAGRAHRQAVRLARAAVPRKLGKGAVYAPKATEVVNAYKNTAAVINADSGAIVTAIGKNKASAATAPNATATTTTSKGISYWWLLIPAAGLALWLYRKTIPFV